MAKQPIPETPKDVVITKRPNGTRRVQHFNSEPSMTKQSEAQSCDINYILSLYIKSNTPLPSGNLSLYGDFSTAGSFQKAMETVITAQQQFDNLPSKIRTKFDNDPAKMLAFVADPKNKANLLELTLDAPPQAPETPKVSAPEQKVGEQK